MKCKDAKVLLSAAIDDELTQGEQLALEQHVSSCAGCAKEKSDFARLKDTMPLWADAEPSPWLAEKFAYKLAELQEAGSACEPRKRLRWGTLSAATAGLAAAVLAVGLLIHGNVPPVREAAPTKPRIEQTTKVAPPPGPKNNITVAGNNPVTLPTHVVSGTHHERRSAVHYTAPVHRQAPQPKTVVAKLPPTPEPVEGSAYAASAGAVTLVAKNTISENLGEASLAMNDTIERVRGNLQKSVDLMVSQPPVPVTDSTHTSGGTP